MSVFDKFLQTHTKPGTPNDCTKVIRSTDCLERNADYAHQCESCREYSRVVTLWNKTPQSKNDKRHATLNKAEREVQS